MAAAEALTRDGLSRKPAPEGHRLTEYAWMATLDLEHLRARLVERGDVLRRAAIGDRDSTEAVELDQSRVGRLSRIDALQAEEMSKATRRRRELELRRIGAALERIDEGGFGLCAACGESIVTGRLEVDPTATLCLACAERAESR